MKHANGQLKSAFWLVSALLIAVAVLSAPLAIADSKSEHDLKLKVQAKNAQPDSKPSFHVDEKAELELTADSSKDGFLNGVASAVKSKLGLGNGRPDADVSVSVAAKDGKTLALSDAKAEWKGMKVNGDKQWNIAMEPPEDLKPGSYVATIKYTDKFGNERSVDQEFVWGVLALNMHKSSYKPGDEVQFDMAVLNDKGNMVCDAELELKISGPSIVVLSTKNGGIQVTDFCNKKVVTTEPDFKAKWKIPDPLLGSGEGKYQISLTAQISNGTHSIEDSFFVADDRPFVVERKAPTRVYPPLTYPMEITVKATRDFSGTITDRVPAGFKVLPLSGASEFKLKNKGDTKLLRWNLDMNKGESYVLGYNIDVPDVSPELFLLGPLSIRNEDGEKFREDRRWEIASDEIGGIGIWTDSTGSQSPTTTFANFSFDDEVRNDGIYTFSGDNTLEFDEAGNYLLIATVKSVDSSNGRVNREGRFTYSGSGDFTTLYGSSYSRNNNNNTDWIRSVGMVWGAEANDMANFQWRRDDDAGVTGSLANASHFQVVRLHDSAAVGIYSDTTDTSAYGTQTWTDAPFNNTILENNTSVIEKQTGNNDIRLKKNNTIFLVGYGLAFSAPSGGTRTQRVSRMVAGSTAIAGSHAYGYMRNSSNEYGNPNNLFLYRNSGTSTDLSVQAQRGNADSAGSGARRTSTSGAFVIELPAIAETMISYDSTGGQDVGGTNGDFNAVETVAHNDAGSFTKIDSSTINAEDDMDVLVLGNAYAERTDTSGARATIGARLEVGGTDKILGEHGNYLRGNQSTTDTYNYSAHASGIYSVSDGDDIQFEWFDAGDDGSVDDTVASGVGLNVINADTFAPPIPPDPPVLYDDDGGSNQIAFNNARISDTTPIFRASATHTEDFDTFEIELNAQSDFGGTAYTETFSGTYTSGTAYNLQTTGSLSLPSTDGVTYYVRARASADGGTNWSSYSSGTWTYTYTSSPDADWFQTTDEQFDTGALTNTQTTGSDSVESNVASTHTFTAAGATTWNVPAGINTLTVKAWGAGGGGGGGGSDATNGVGGDGAGGGFAQSKLTVTPGEQLDIHVGGGGGGGVVQGTTTAAGDGGGGGGRSEVERNSSSTALLVAGAGGGGGGGDNSGGGGSAPGGNGGYGGGFTGGAGQASGSAGGGGGGSQSAGGSAGTGGATNGTAGVLISGGDGGDNNAGTQGGATNGGTTNGGDGGLASSAAYGGGGGGGSGRYGGGGGASSAAGEGGAGAGGGGSNYLTGSSQINLQASGTEAANNSDLDYSAGVGVGGAGNGPCTDGSCAGSDGGNGRIVITYDHIGTIMSPEVDFDDNTYTVTGWGEMQWSEDETNGSVSMQLYYTSSTACDTIVPDSALSGNSGGFSSSPVNISGLNTSTYNEICMRATLESDSGGQPSLDDWTISWGGLSIPPDPPVLYDDDGGSNQIAFNNARISDTTPIFRASATHTEDFDTFEIELNAQSDFGGTAYTETFSGTYTSGTAYNLQTTGSLSLPSTDGVTYYVRARASADGGTNWSSYSSGTWTYTYTSSPDADWFQTTDEQFDTGALNGAKVSGSDSIETDSGPLGEAGTFTSQANGAWSTISFNNTYESPVVVGVTNSRTGNNALVFESRNVTSTQADMRVCESDGETATGCAAHSAETVGYMVIDSDAIGNATGIEAGTFNIGGSIDVSTTNVTYDGTYSTPPLVFASAQTVDDTDPIEARVMSTTTTGFAAGICQQNATDGCNDFHGIEKVGWVAIDPDNIPFHQLADAGSINHGGGDTWTSTGTFGVSFSSTPVIVAKMYGNNGTQRLEISEADSVTTTSANVRFCEIDGPDTCDGHNSNDVAWLAIESGNLSADTGGGTITSEPIGIDSNISYSSWDEVNWSEEGSNGVVTMQVLYTNSTTCDTLVPDGDLSGNSGGLSTSPVKISALNTTTYDEICIRATLTDSGGTPELEDWAVSWGAGNNYPDAPANLTQTKTDDTVLSTGEWTDETSVKFTADASDTDNPEDLQLCIEVDQLGTGFSNVENSCGTAVTYSGSIVSVNHTISGLTDGAEYHWQARIKDDENAYSSWVSYGGNSESERDVGIDGSPPTGGAVYDGDTAGVDAAFNDGSLDTLSANWSSFDFSTSGLLRYEYSVGSTQGGTDIKNWTDNATNDSVTDSSLSLRTSQIYYVNVRAIDTAGNSSIVSSDGQSVLPTLSFNTTPTDLAFDQNLNAGNSYTDTEQTTLTTSTNAYAGYVVRAHAVEQLTFNSAQIGWFDGGTYASPASWGSSTGYGYTSDDSDIQGGGDKFGSGSLYAPFSTTAPGDIVADNISNQIGTPITNESFTITHRVTVDSAQEAGRYNTNLMYIVTAEY